LGLTGSGSVCSTVPGSTKRIDYDLDSLLKIIYREMLVRDGSTRAGLEMPRRATSKLGWGIDDVWRRKARMRGCRSASTANRPPIRAIGFIAVVFSPAATFPFPATPIARTAGRADTRH
jgi:hypothetical protein